MAIKTFINTDISNLKYIYWGARACVCNTVYIKNNNK